MNRLLLTVMFFATGLVAQTAKVGIIQGTVTDDAGNALGGALISAIQQGPGTPSTSLLTRNVLSTASGAYEIDNLPAGTYTICGQFDSGGVLNPCVWSSQPLTATVSAGATTTGVAIVMQRGAIVHLTLADPQQLLTTNASRDDVLVGVSWGNAPFQLAKVLNKTATGRTLSILVPAGQQVSIGVFSSVFSLAAAGGDALPTAAGSGGKVSVVSVNATKGQQTNITVQISGLASATAAQ